MTSIWALAVDDVPAGGLATDRSQRAYPNANPRVEIMKAGPDRQAQSKCLTAGPRSYPCPWLLGCQLKQKHTKILFTNWVYLDHSGALKEELRLGM